MSPSVGLEENVEPVERIDRSPLMVDDTTQAVQYHNDTCLTGFELFREVGVKSVVSVGLDDLRDQEGEG